MTDDGLPIGGDLAPGGVSEELRQLVQLSIEFDRRREDYSDPHEISVMAGDVRLVCVIASYGLVQSMMATRRGETTGFNDEARAEVSAAIQRLVDVIDFEQGVPR